MDGAIICWSEIKPKDNTLKVGHDRFEPRDRACTNEGYESIRDNQLGNTAHLAILSPIDLFCDCGEGAASFRPSLFPREGGDSTSTLVVFTSFSDISSLL